jgi:hypothetical protein
MAAEIIAFPLDRIIHRDQVDHHEAEQTLARQLEPAYKAAVEEHDYRRGSDLARSYLAGLKHDSGSVALAGYLSDAQLFATCGTPRNYVTDGFGDTLQKGLVNMLRHQSGARKAKR